MEFDETLAALERWLEERVAECERDEARANVLRALWEDPTMLERGFSVLRAMGERILVDRLTSRMERDE